MSTDRENFIAAFVEHRRPDRILYKANFVDDLADRLREYTGKLDLNEHYGFFCPEHVSLEAPEDYEPINYAPFWEGQDLAEGTTLDGNGVAMEPSGFFHFWGYVSPLRNAKSLDEIENYPLELAEGWDDSRMAAKVAAAHEAGKVTCCFVGHMYEEAWQVRGYEQFLMDTIERPAWAECLLQRFFERNLRKAEAAAKAGVMLIQCGDDVANQNAMMFSKPTWESLIHSRWKQIWQRVHEINPDAQTWYHTDGNCISIVDDMVRDGLNILNPIQPEALDIDAVYKKHGVKISFDGGMGTQSTMPWGTAQDVRDRVKVLIDKYGKDGGLMVSPTHILEPEVPLENIDAFADACREYGALGG
jgi:uroporphyrinogen decarboxylase